MASIRLIFHEAGVEPQWTLDWEPTGDDVFVVPFKMHYADGSGGEGDLLLGYKEIRQILDCILDKRLVKLSVPLSTFIQPTEQSND